MAFSPVVTEVPSPQASLHPGEACRHVRPSPFSSLGDLLIYGQTLADRYKEATRSPSTDTFVPLLLLKHRSSSTALKDTAHTLKNVINHLWDQGQSTHLVRSFPRTHTKKRFPKGSSGEPQGQSGARGGGTEVELGPVWAKRHGGSPSHGMLHVITSTPAQPPLLFAGSPEG